MQTIILVGICVECMILLCLALLKKLTKKAFAAISGVTFVCCLAGAFMSISGQGEEKKVNEKEYIYMAARLVEDGYPEASLQALEQVQDKGNEVFGIKTLRGLDYNQTGSYQIAILCLKEEENEHAIEISNLSRMDEQADEAFCTEVAEEIIKTLALESGETARLDAEMKLRFLSEYQTADSGMIEEVQDKDTWIRARKAVLDGEYEQAYEIVSEDAKDGNIKDVIIVSNMYVKNYNRRFLANSDREYDRLWQNLTDAQVNLNLADSKMNEEKSGEESTGSGESNTQNDLEKEYETAAAEYRIASDELFHETVKRAINYMEANKPENAEENIAYQLQMARLYYQADKREEAEDCLRLIFETEEIDTEQWLGWSIYLLRESYLLSMSDGQSDEFNSIFENVMQALYQNLFSDEYIVSFREFCKECLDNIFKGIVIGKVNRDNYPQIVLEVSAINQELVLTDTSFRLTDTEEEIKDLKVMEKEMPIMSVCFVLDRSGSMSGRRLSDAKNAIKESVLKMGDDTYVGLVSFDDSSRIDCNLTISKYAISGTVENIRDEGGTNIAAGLRDALEVLSSAPGEKVILLLSDGYDGGYESIDDVLFQLRDNNITVFTIGLEGCDEAYLSEIANVTGGEYISVSDTAKLASVYEQIQQTLSNVYYVTYTVTSLDEERTVKIRMTGSFVQAMKNYTRTEKMDIEVQEDMDEIQQSNYFKQIGGSAGGR